MNSQMNQAPATTQPITLQSVARFLRETVTEAKAIVLPPPPIIARQFSVVLVLSAFIVVALYLINMLFVSVISDIKHSVNPTQSNHHNAKHPKLR